MKAPNPDARWCSRDPLPPLPFYALVVSEAGMLEELKRLDEPYNFAWISAGAHATVHHFAETEKHKACSIVAISGFESRTGIQIAGLLVHEATHLWQRYRDEILRETEPSAELEAYTVQWIAQELMEQYVLQVVNTKGKS